VNKKVLRKHLKQPVLITDSQMKYRIKLLNLVLYLLLELSSPYELNCSGREFQTVGLATEKPVHVPPETDYNKHSASKGSSSVITMKTAVMTIIVGASEW